jgi:hypothetical protein
MPRPEVISGVIVAEGLKELNQNLQALGDDKTELKAANYEAAKLLIKRAKPLVPVRSGRLLSTLRPANKAGYALARAGLAKVPYANVIHWGWLVVGERHKGVRKKGRYVGIAPQPFFSEALGYSYEQIITEYYEALGNLMVKHNLK